MKLSPTDTQRVITHLLKNEDHRTVILALINAEFLEYAIQFFIKVAEAKMRNIDIDGDWYKREFITNEDLSTNDMIINAGLNKKTVENIYKTANRQLVIEIVPKYYDELLAVIQTLTSQDSEIDLTLNIKFRGTSIDLTINESLIVINTLAVKRAQLRGGAWSTLGKQIEKPLMLTLCALFGVSPDYYRLVGKTGQGREVDFYLLNEDKEYPCEIKLMGKGNPEVADAIFARQSAVFIADKLSNLNKSQSDTYAVLWVELSALQGYQRFYTILQTLNIPSKPFNGNLDIALPAIFATIFE
ncbi:MAG: CfrBI family restriction endonuclease [Phototrophicales bacterium]|nr:CfrBI family restriction endonuclease [Phototrophicales bacterium]